jgi:hypothetical protein
MTSIEFFCQIQSRKYHYIVENVMLLRLDKEKLISWKVPGLKPALCKI